MRSRPRPGRHAGGRSGTAEKRNAGDLAGVLVLPA